MYLLSDKAAMVHGVVLPVDGGLVFGWSRSLEHLVTSSEAVAEMLDCLLLATVATFSTCSIFLDMTIQRVLYYA